MNVSFASPMFSAAALYFTGANPQPRTFGRAPTLDSGVAFQPLLAQVAQLRTFLEQLDSSLSAMVNPAPASSAATRAVSLTSSAALGLSPTTTPTTLTSTEQVNAVTTSFTPFGPSWSGASTSLATIGGTYDGSGGNDTLTFKVKKAGNVGGPYTGNGGAPADLRIEVRKGNNALLQNIDFTEATAPNTPFALSNGLTVAFAAGSLVNNNTFTVAVSHTTPSAVDVTKAVDGTRNNNPNFEAGLAVTPGSFQINGVAIAVNAGDTTNTLLARITNSAAGVIASFDAGTEKVTLTQKSNGSSAPIALGPDSSGFLSAVKLAAVSTPTKTLPAAVPVPGLDPEYQRPLAQVGALAGIQSGSFAINGVSFTVNRATDSLSHLVADINASAAGVTATYANDKLTLTSRNKRASVQLDDGTSGFFSAVQIAPGAFTPDPFKRPTQTTEAGALAATVRQGFDELNRRVTHLVGTGFGGIDPAEVRASRDAMRDAVKTALTNHFDFGGAQLDTGRAIDSQLGLQFTLDDFTSSLFHTDESRLRQMFALGPERMLDFLVADTANEHGQGLLKELTAAVKAVENNLIAKVGSAKGVLLDAAA